MKKTIIDPWIDRLQDHPMGRNPNTLVHILGALHPRNGMAIRHVLRKLQTSSPLKCKGARTWTHLGFSSGYHQQTEQRQIEIAPSELRFKCVAVRTAVCGSAAMCGSMRTSATACCSVRGSVRQCMWQCVAVRLAVCDSMYGRKYAAVWLCAAVCGSVPQFAAVCFSVL
jgi:hypothetical protein